MQYHESIPSTVVIGPRKTPLEDFTAQKDADNFESVDSDEQRPRCWLWWRAVHAPEPAEADVMVRGSCNCPRQEPEKQTSVHAGFQSPADGALWGF